MSTAPGPGSAQGTWSTGPAALPAPAGGHVLWRLHAVSFTAYLAFGTLFQVFPPHLDALRHAFGLSPGQASLVMTGFLAPAVPAALLGGFAVDRYGVLWISRLGFALLLAGAALSALGPAFALVVSGRAVSGLGGGLLVVAVLKLVVAKVPPRARAAALGLFVAGLPAGTGLAFNLLRALGHAAGWRVAVGGAGLVVLGSLAFFELSRRRVVALPDHQEPAGIPRDQQHILANRSLWLLAATTVLGYTAIIAFTTWAPTRLIGYAHLSAQQASALASLLLVIDIPLAPLWGRACDLTGKREPFILLALAVYGLGALSLPAVVGLSHGSPLVLTALIALMGVSCAAFFPATLSIPGDLAAPAQVGVAYGLVFTAQLVGMMSGPALLGLLFDHGYGTAAGFYVVAGVSLAGLLMALWRGARARRRSPPVEGPLHARRRDARGWAGGHTQVSDPGEVWHETGAGYCRPEHRPDTRAHRGR
jgi:DHA1 family inner membrane transport protein